MKPDEAINTVILIFLININFKNININQKELEHFHIVTNFSPLELLIREQFVLD